MHARTIRNLRPVFVIIGFSLAIVVLNRIAQQFGFEYTSQILDFLPRWLIIISGVLLIFTWLPIFVAGIRTLGRRTATGHGDRLIIQGVYRFVRNPMYAGLSLTLFGMGLFIGVTAVAVAPLLGLLVAWILSRREEKTLAERYGVEYLTYKKRTPMFIPNFVKLISVMFSKNRAAPSDRIAR
jgi:protein-S-isoprenylcysteine O-methyltransferase Ste14